MQQKKGIFYICLLCLSLCACSKDGALAPSNKDKNWFVVQDNPADAVDHLIYTVYQQTGVPIYYNDTIGQQEQGKDVYGNTIIDYQTLNLFYTLTNTNYTQGRCAPVQDRNALLTGVNFLKDRVLPFIPKAAYPKSFYLVDTIFPNSYSTADSYRGLKTTAIAHVSELSQWTDSALKVLAGNVIGAEVGSYVSVSYPVELAPFYAVSTSILNKNLYGYFMTTSQFPGTQYDYGFLAATIYSPDAYSGPTQDVDLKSYAVAILTTDEATFKNTYAAYPYVLKKYDLLKALLKSHQLI